MSQNRETLDYQETKTNKGNRVLRRLVTAGLAGSLALGAAGCSTDKVSAVPQPSETTSSSVGGEVTSTPTGTETAKSTMSDNEVLYANYSDTLSPAQKEKRLALSPDNVAVDSDATITKNFIITATEITGPDGKIDPSKLAEAWASRQQAMITAGSSLKEWDKLGGVSKYNLDSCTQLADKYIPVMGQAVYGHDLEDKSTTANTCFRFATVENAKTKPGQTAKSIESYRFRVTPFKDTAPNITPNPDGSFKIELRELTSDNWDEKGFQEVIGVLHSQTYSETDWKLTVNVNKAADRMIILEADSTTL